MLVGLLGAVGRWLPRGRTLSEEAWQRRHRVILVLLWLHAAFIPAFALVRGFSVEHTAFESAIVPSFAIVAAIRPFGRRVRMGAASLGLLSSSAVLVHLSGGLIEMHFHFFVMVPLVALYQDWVPFLTSIGYVLIHHGTLGTIDPSSVYNHPAAIRSPWTWAGVHALFISGISVFCLISWRINETVLAERLRVEDRLRRESRIVETLNFVGKTLAAELDQRGVMQKVTDAATDLTSAAFGAFFANVEDVSGGSYMLYTLSGAPEEAFARFPMPRNTALFGETFNGSSVVRIADVTEDPRYGKSPPFFGMPEGHLPVRSYLAVPVRSRSGTVLGGLFFGHPERGRFSEDDERLATGIASHAAIAFDNARLYESERDARARLAVLAEASRGLSSSLELDRILGHLAGTVVPVVADACAVFLADEDGSIRRVAARPEDDVGGFVAIDDPQNPIAVAIEQRRSQVLTEGADSLGAAMPATPELYSGAGPGVVVPLEGRSGVFGAIVLLAGISRRWSDAELDLAEELARRAAVAVENAMLYAAKRTAAETLQHSLLPEALPQLPGIETDVRYIPGGPSVDVGGDWYDVMELGDGSIGLVMGDVVGRGVAAAALMGQLRNALRAFALEGHDPAVVLAKLNAMLHEVGPSDAMATLAYCVFDPDTGTLRFSNAGHPPPLIVGIDSSVDLLEEGLGPPLGATTRARYGESITTLAPGAMLLLYTDGLIEDRTMELDDGIIRLRAAVAEPIGDLGTLCDTVLARCLAGREVKDDIAVLVMRALAFGPTLRLRLPARGRVLKPLRATLRRWLVGVGAGEDEAFDVLVACGEACANAIQHPSRQSPDFELDAGVENGILTIAVRDQGPWRPPRQSLGGRGLRIINELMDSVEVAKSSEGTEVTMRRRIAVSERSGSPA